MTHPSSTPSPASPPEFVIPPRYWSWLGWPAVRRGLGAAAVVVVGILTTLRAWHSFDDPPHRPPAQRRADGNSGHAQIDFGGQWVMGRMLATGYGRELYHRQRQWTIVREAYPVDDESPLQRTGIISTDELSRHDATNLMSWFMGRDPPEWRIVGGAVVLPLAQPPLGQPLVAIALEQAASAALTPDVIAAVNEPAIGGPLYPPVQALFYAPWGMIDSPRRAYHLFQVFAVLLVPLAGWSISWLAQGRIPGSVATLALFFYPGMRAGLDLGQNPTISLVILLGGWVLACRGYHVAGGMVWGLLAFKPVWAAAFIVVPLLMGRWRFLVAMLATGAGLAVATLPLVGIASWFHWLTIGQEAAELYQVNTNWIDLSRDLQGIPRRWLLDFQQPQHQRASAVASRWGWALWGFVFGTTVVVYGWRGDRRRPTGLSAGFLFLGAYLTCFHFMYYDALLSAVAVAVLLADPRPFWRTKCFPIECRETVALWPPPLVANAAPRPPLRATLVGYINSFPLTVVATLFVVENLLVGLELEATLGVRRFAQDGIAPRLQADTGLRYPLDTFILLALWAWCGWQLLRNKRSRWEVVERTAAE
ncbi:MAG: glycosyltransferase family 87 protein [Gemmataceae bacterium]|nr:DUF2029 domain-containing protein [Gemmata sp.]MDW8199536.1 glycosyltransferase family 87 protein [Gemmataceae bacterium]